MDFREEIMRIDLERSAAAVLLFVLIGGANAAQRTFVASYGNDALSCSLAQPCRGFQAAVNAVDPGGEVVALDSGGYGSMSINKSVSVIVPSGIHAGLSPTTGIPIPGFPGQSAVVLIDIGDNDVVVLRGLHVSHQGSVTGGIDWVSQKAGTVHIENTVVSGFPNEGLYVQAADLTTAVPHLHLKDSIFRNNGAGVWLRGFEFNTVVVIADRVRTERNSLAGYVTDGPHTLDLRDCVIASNTHGIQSNERNSKAATYRLENCLVTGNDVAFYFTVASASSHIFVSGSSISSNGQGYVSGAASGKTYSRGNNTVNGNGNVPFTDNFAPQ